VLLWDATVDSFASGVWVATILCAQATCERILAALVSIRELPGAGIEGPRNWQKWGLGTLIKHVRNQGRVPEDLLNEVNVLCEARKPYGHFRHPFDKGTIGRQVAVALEDEGWGPTLRLCGNESFRRRRCSRPGRRCGCTSAASSGGHTKDDRRRVRDRERRPSGPLLGRVQRFSTAR